MSVFFSRNFIKQLDRSPQKIREFFNERLELFLKEPFSPELNNHKLKGKFNGHNSLNITGDWRAVYYISRPDYYFVKLGRHTDLYK